MDRLKLVLGGETYIKEIIDTCPHLYEHDLLAIKVSYMQIMGFKAALSIIHIQDKDLFVTEDLTRFCFPSSKKQIRKGGIAQLIKAFSLVKHLLSNLEGIIEAGKIDNGTNKMRNITEKSTNLPKSDFKLWVNELMSEMVSDEEEEEKKKGEEEEEEAGGLWHISFL